MTRGFVPEAHRAIGILVARRATPVRHELVEQHGDALRVDHPEPPLRRRQRVVDHRQRAVVDAAGRFEAVEDGERAGEQVGAGESGVGSDRRGAARGREEQGGGDHRPRDAARDAARSSSHQKTPRRHFHGPHLTRSLRIDQRGAPRVVISWSCWVRRT